MELNNYKDTWNNRVTSLKSGAIAVDGSTDEETLLSNGKWTADQMQAALDINNNDVVLEMGCGVARIGKLLAPHCKKWIGVDISENMLNVAQQRLSDLNNVEFHALKRNDLSAIADNSIDKIYTVAVFCHLDKEDLFNYLREFYRILKPGGVIYAETWNMASDIGWKRWQYEADNWFISDHSQRKDVARNQFCSPDEFDLYVRKAGFDISGSYSDSVWNQIIASKEMSEDNKQTQLDYLNNNKDKIVYSQLFSELFEYAMDVTYNAIHPKVMMTFIDTLGDIPVAVLYRRFLIGLWANNEELWGKVEE
jgi:ubiquinone/menaquinone biosynthesis C-methylase UbiE